MEAEIVWAGISGVVRSSSWLLWIEYPRAVRHISTWRHVSDLGSGERLILGYLGTDPIRDQNRN